MSTLAPCPACNGHKRRLIFRLLEEQALFAAWSTLDKASREDFQALAKRSRETPIETFPGHGEFVVAADLHPEPCDRCNERGTIDLDGEARRRKALDRSQSRARPAHVRPGP